MSALKLRRLVVFCCFFLLAATSALVLLRKIQPSVHAQEAAPNIQPDLNADTKADPQAFAKYQAAIRDLFARNNYEELDRLGNTMQANKERFSGGYRKLTQIYFALQAPPDAADPSGAAWAEHFEHIRQWQSVSPGSITATIALAAAYLTHASSARGDGLPDSVSEQNWKIYHDSTAKAHKILDDNAALIAKDPMAKYLMLRIAHFEGWEPEREKPLFESAIAFDPTYRAYYRQQAIYLRPQWFGEEGDIARLAADVYKRMGPVNGPIAYFEIANVTVCNCGPRNEGDKLSLTKIKEGYQLSVQNYGEAIEQENRLAFIAWQKQDLILLQELVKKIGDNYVPDAWENHREYFTNLRSALVPPTNFGPEPLQSVEEQTKTPAGRDYAERLQTEFDTKYSKILADCRTQAGDDLRGFYIYLKQDGSGQLSAAFLYPSDAMASCFGKSTALDERPKFSAPPHADYWNKIVVLDH